MHPLETIAMISAVQPLILLIIVRRMAAQQKKDFALGQELIDTANRIDVIRNRRKGTR